MQLSVRIKNRMPATVILCCALPAWHSVTSPSAFRLSGIRILWDGVSFLELSVPAEFASRMCGLCGNFNGDPADDVLSESASAPAATGSGYSLSEGGEGGVGVGGDAWRVGGLRACSVLPRDMLHSYEPHCTQTWHQRISSDRYCNALNSTLFSACANKVPPAYYYNACRSVRSVLLQHYTRLDRTIPN